MSGAQHTLFDAALGHRKRDRSREGAGKSQNSHIKHSLVRRAVGAQLGAFRLRNRGRIVLIDGNAGDGRGVEQPQSDLFGDNPSCATAELLIQFAQEDGNADVVLCEADAAKRAELAARFPSVTVVGDHQLAPGHVTANHVYALWLSDPCGPSAHGVPHMRAVSDKVRADFVVVFNEGWIVNRLLSTQDARWATSRSLYGPMVPPSWWQQALNRRFVSRTQAIINGAPNFKYRVLVVSDVLSQGATRKPFEAVL